MRSTNFLVLFLVAILVSGCKPATTTTVTKCVRVAEDDKSCDGRDDDCDGEIDEDYQSKSTNCGTGICAAKGARECLDGKTVDKCQVGTPTAETCNNKDDDCDGKTDENLDRLCMKDCTSGREFCNHGQWGGCDAPGAQSEVCDKVDNDCDGETDDGCPNEPHSKCGDGTCAGLETCHDCEVDCGHCPAECGDNLCLTGETSVNCPEDCEALCGDGVCNADESPANCPGDCPAVCGDLTCSTGEQCPSDCPATCGDGQCEDPENLSSCPSDCPAFCGDGKCTGGESAEDCESCADDCGSCADKCGNGTCEQSIGEDSNSCPVDCPKGICATDAECDDKQILTVDVCHLAANPPHCHGVVKNCTSDEECTSVTTPDGTIVTVTGLHCGQPFPEGPYFCIK